MYIRLSKNTFPLAMLVIAIIVSYIYFTNAEKRYRNIVSFSSCISAGYRISNTYPETCSIPGKVFVNESQVTSKDTSSQATTSSLAINDVTNLSYLLDGQSIVLTNGEGIFPSSSIEGITTVHIAGKVLLIDINGDSLEDSTFLFENSSGKDQGKPSKYYVTSALKLTTGYVGLNILTIGNASTTPSLIYKNGFIYVTYTDIYTKKVERHFLFENNLLKEILEK